jgi:hypothetical protein
MSNNITAMRFDTPLIGVPFTEGYRLLFGKFAHLHNANEVPFDDYAIESWLCDNYGTDGTTLETDSDYILQNPGVWVLLHRSVGKYNRYLSLNLVVQDVAILESLVLAFGYTLTVSEEETLAGQIKTKMTPYMFSALTRRLIRKIQVDVAEILNKNSIKAAWYNIKVDQECSVLHVPLDNKTLVIRL